MTRSLKIRDAVAISSTAKVVILVGSNIRHEIPHAASGLHKAEARQKESLAINPIDFEFTFPLAGKPNRQTFADARQGEFSQRKWPISPLKSARRRCRYLVGELAENHAQASQFMRLCVSLRPQQVRRSIVSTRCQRSRLKQRWASCLRLARKNAAAMLESGLWLTYFMAWSAYDFANNAKALKALANSKVIAFTAYASEHLKSLHM